jgi:hypothetical protein
MRSDAWGGLGRSPVGHLMMGLATLFCGSDDVAEGLRFAQQAIVRDTKDFVGNLDTNLLAFLNNNASPDRNGSLNVAGFEQSLRTFYSENSSAMTSSYRVINILRHTYQLTDNEGGITRFVDQNGTITDRAGFNAYAIQLVQRELNRNTNRLNFLYQTQGLIVRNGQVATASGRPLTQDQIDFIRGAGAQLTFQNVRLTNALATLQTPATLSAN